MISHITLTFTVFAITIGESSNGNVKHVAQNLYIQNVFCVVIEFVTRILEVLPYFFTD